MPRIGHALTASAKKVSFSTRIPGKLKEEPWQDRAWDAYDRVPAVAKAIEWRRNVARKIDYFVARRESPTEDPEPVETGPAVEVLDQVGGPNLIRTVVADLVTHWGIVGEAHLASIDETWRVYSTQELRKATSGMAFVDAEGAETGTIDEASVYRVWRPHPRFRRMARSPLRPLLDTIEEWLILSREMRARGISRIPAGILFISKKIDLGDPTDPDTPSFDAELMRRMTRPVADPGSADSLVPWVVTADIEDWDKFVKHLSFARDYQIPADMRQELLRQLALGVNLPPSVVLGIEGMNDWSAWQADDSSIRQYADPDILEILESLTESWYRPLLEAASVPGASEFLLYRDLAPAVVPADRSKLALDGYDAILISGEATRREIGFDETDAPSPEEVEERIRIAQAIKVAPVPIGSEQGPGGPMRSALIAAAEATISGERLTRIDQDLLAYVIAQAEAAIDSALEIAGRKLKASVKQNGLRELLAAVPLRMVAATLGPENVALYQTLGELVPEGSFASVIDRIGRRIAVAQEAARREVERLTGGAVESDGEETEDRRSALSIILRALVAAAAAALFTPDPSPDPADLGEVGDTRVPVAELREALSVAGGGASSFEGAKASELVGNGARSVRQLEVATVRTLSFVWVYGTEPRQEFPPHRSLDGEEFDTWESETLSVDPFYAWLGRGFYRPGDHRGCRCSYERVMTIAALAPESLAASV